MWKNYLKTAVRALLRYKVYSFINIIGLSLGLACAMLIILYVRDEVSYDAFHVKGRQIYRVGRQLIRPDGSTQESGYTGYFQGPRFAAQVPEVQGFSAIAASAGRYKDGIRDSISIDNPGGLEFLFGFFFSLVAWRSGNLFAITRRRRYYRRYCQAAIRYYRCRGQDHIIRG